MDDDADFLFQNRVQLEAAGLKVITAPGAGAAEKILADHKPDLAVVDLMMEHPDAGFTLCYHIRKRYPGTPVIVITSVTSETGLDFDVATEAERSWIQADAILPKPIRYEQLQREIDRFLGV